MPGKYKIVMIRHGESEWNQKNLFCGWFDADLSPKGKLHINIPDHLHYIQNML